MLYILDTDMVIFMLRGLKAPARQRARREKALALVARCREAQTKGDAIGLSAVTVSELGFGAYKSGSYDTEIVANNLAHFQLSMVNLFRVSDPRLAIPASAHINAVFRPGLERSTTVSPRGRSRPREARSASDAASGHPGPTALGHPSSAGSSTGSGRAWRRAIGRAHLFRRL